jgi:hypothetical protein
MARADGAAALSGRSRQPDREVFMAAVVLALFAGMLTIAAPCWNILINQPWKIMSIARRDWAVVGHSI